MDLSKIPTGKSPPKDINVVVEIPLGSAPVKYELDKASGALFVDRLLHTSMIYPGHYGFIPHTLSEDGDPTDCLVVGRSPLFAGVVVRSRPIGVLKMEDESGPDEKILAVPHPKLHPFYDDVKTYRDLPQIILDQIAHFFAHYKDLEPGKWARITGWYGPEEAEKLIEEAIARAKAKG